MRGVAGGEAWRACSQFFRLTTRLQPSLRTNLVSTRRQHTGMMASEEKWPAKKVRSTFIKYFEDHGHTAGTRSAI